MKRKLIGAIIVLCVLAGARLVAQNSCKSLDDKIIAVAANDMSVNHINDISDLPRHFMRELRAFFEDYKKLEEKEVKIEDFLGKEDAMKIIEQSFVDYKELMSKN